ncbi:MAG TPA: pyridoxamine 5'-phosphate oxidase family protein [Acidimicrobiales bacterium]|nr:pyridoxamine 5'-phosphate oxidase family protein [Acidimicrobiales bacterium]
MGRTWDSITPQLRAFVERQHLFFVASAPLSADGHVNLSPKGHDSLRILDDHTVAYLDLTGSGIETVAHVLENGRITLMFCAFEGPPQIVRFQGVGRAHAIGTPEYDELAPHFTLLPGARAIVVVDVRRVSTSCGFAVPVMAYQHERSRLIDWAEHHGPDGVAEYVASENAESIDGLPALSVRE